MRASLDFAIPLGLLITELTTNAFSHAFSKDSNGQITISLKRPSPHEVVLTVGDNGSAQRESLSNPVGVGARITKALVRQLNGNATMLQKDGTIVAVVMKQVPLRPEH